MQDKLADNKIFWLISIRNGFNIILMSLITKASDTKNLKIPKNNLSEEIFSE